MGFPHQVWRWLSGAPPAMRHEFIRRLSERDTTAEHERVSFDAVTEGSATAVPRHTDPGCPEHAEEATDPGNARGSEDRECA